MRYGAIVTDVHFGGITAYVFDAKNESCVRDAILKIIEVDGNGSQEKFLCGVFTMNEKNNICLIEAIRPEFIHIPHFKATGKIFHRLKKVRKYNISAGSSIRWMTENLGIPPDF